MMVLFSAALFLIPLILSNFTGLVKHSINRILSLISLLLILDFVLVLANSSAPFEQQFFGRTGRGLGLATEFSLLIFMLAACQFSAYSNISILLKSLTLAVFVSSFYSILQRFGLDIFEWETRTNGIIGTLGNPNFQSSFAAMAIMPVVTIFWDKRNGKVFTIILVTPLIAVLYFSESTQGYLATILVVLLSLLIYSWYRNRNLFILTLTLTSISGVLAILGMVNKGPLSDYLYKYSVRSRGEFFRTGVSIIKDNKLFGVGFDSVGDNYLMYRSAKDAKGVGEFTDHLHNIHLNYAAVGGIPLAILQSLFIILVIYSFFKVQKRINRFDKNVTALFCAWACYQSQALISPSNISMLTWNAIITGAIIGLNPTDLSDTKELMKPNISRMQLIVPFSNFLLILGVIIMIPLFNVDRQSLLATRTGDGNLALKAATSYPESTIRYSRIGQQFIKSNLAPQALEIGRAAAKFNPNAASAWGLILVNNLAPREERLKAQQELLRLDPHNDEIRNLVIPETRLP
jgi:hypothetical protein